MGVAGMTGVRARRRVCVWAGGGCSTAPHGVEAARTRGRVRLYQNTQSGEGLHRVREGVDDRLAAARQACLPPLPHLPCTAPMVP